MASDIKSEYGPPFDNNDWSERKEEIKNLLQRPIQWQEGYMYYLAAEDLYAALEAEESDNAMLATNIAKIYDYASGGRISKPNTYPEEVYAILEERINREREEAYEEGKSDLLYEEFGGTLPR